jgi:hypothetical protein
MKFYANTPELWFSKTHKETGVVFEDHFSGKNLPGWYQTAFCEMMARAESRIQYWNSQLSSWNYELLGWRV